MSGNGLVEAQADRQRNRVIPGDLPVGFRRGGLAPGPVAGGEFSAPVGILDPNLRSWRTIVGAPAHHFPGVDDQFLEVAGSRAAPAGPGCALATGTRSRQGLARPSSSQLRGCWTWWLLSAS